MDIANELKRIRGERSIYSVSKSSGVQEIHINRIELGEVKPTFETAQKIAEACGYRFKLEAKD